MFKMFKGGDGVSVPVGGRIRWPWSSMSVGDVVTFSDDSVRFRAQIACHVHGRQARMKFKTVTKDGVLYVTRVE